MIAPTANAVGSLSPALLRRYKPDVFGVQEALFGQVKDIQATLSDHRWIGIGREGGSRGEFGAVFYNTERSFSGLC